MWIWLCCERRTLGGNVLLFKIASYPVGIQQCIPEIEKGLVTSHILGCIVVITPMKIAYLPDQ
jgi:hypothetical protein